MIAAAAGVGTGLDAVGHHFVGRAVQRFHAVYGQVGRADTLDLRAHRGQQAAQVHDLRLARGVEQAAGAISQHRRHQRILGRAHADHGEVEFAAGQAAIGRVRLDVTLRQLDLATQRLDSLQVQIDGPVADGAAAGQRDGRFPAARQHRAEHEDRGAHLAHQIVGCDGGGQARCLERDNAAKFFRALAANAGADAELRHQVLEPVDIGQPRQVAQCNRFLGQQRARDQRQRAVLRTRNRDGAGKAVAAANDKFVHCPSIYRDSPRRQERPLTPLAAIR